MELGSVDEKETHLLGTHTGSFTLDQSTLDALGVHSPERSPDVGRPRLQSVMSMRSSESGYTPAHQISHHAAKQLKEIDRQKQSGEDK